MYKLLILAYLITQDPIATQQTFQMQQTYNTMEDCKKELLLQFAIENYKIAAGNEIVTVRSDLFNGSEKVVSSWSTLVVRA